MVLRVTPPGKPGSADVALVRMEKGSAPATLGLTDQAPKLAPVVMVKGLLFFCHMRGNTSRSRYCSYWSWRWARPAGWAQRAYQLSASTLSTHTS